MYARYSTANALAKAEALCTFSRSFGSEPRYRLTRTEALSLHFDAFSLREPVPASLETALERRLRGGARHHVPGYEEAADQSPRQAGAGAPPGEGRDNG